MAYFLGVAHDVRVLLAELGFSSLEDVIGHTELLEQVVWGEPAGEMDLSPLLWRPRDDLETCHGGERNDPPLPGGALSARLLEELERTWDGRPQSLGPFDILNTDRTVGAPISGWLASLPDVHDLQSEAVRLSFCGTAGQSFGAFCCHGLSLHLVGSANDYVAKGMSGGVVVVTPGDQHRESHQNAIAGNTVLYGATGGTLLMAGRAGQRFAVRNSGATAVVEGVGEHACEYMTGGTVVVLGRVGRNFAAGMTGGEAYLFLYESEEDLLRKVNHELVQVEVVSDDKKLRALVELHAERTGSAWSRRMLDNWQANLSRFRRVAPQPSAASIEARNEGVLSGGV